IIEAAEVRQGDECSECGSELQIARGIEIGHIFQLGRKYAEALDLKVLDENGELITVTMGSYGIGVTRAVATVAEQSHDEKGLIWPREVSPADIHIIAAGKDDAIFEFAERAATDLEALGVRVLYDDRRGVSPGVKFNDSELLGIPTIAVVGKGLSDGVIELRDRRSGEQRLIPIDQFVSEVIAEVKI
ncbi:MAG: His/Gly/Thr/Pro-type tRNA ligase C-terminal domain-containing protein, partial [Actinomycetes bacterium]